MSWDLHCTLVSPQRSVGSTPGWKCCCPGVKRIQGCQAVRQCLSPRPGHSRVAGLRQDLKGHAEARQLLAQLGVTRGISEALATGAPLNSRGSE